MSDPVREAANRARIIPGAVYSERVLAETAAREALKKVRELHKPEEINKYGSVWCSCGTGDPFLDNYWKDCPTAQACYSSEELENWERFAK